jgi:cell division protein FtsW
MLVMSGISTQRIRPFVIILLAFSLLLLLLVFVPGIGLSANGATRWLRLWPTTFQPSELVKLTMVFFLADYMAKNMHRMKELKYGIIIPVGVMMLFQGIIIMQPDFGAVMSLGILTMGLLFLGGARLIHIGSLILLALPAVYILVTSSPYRMKRVLSFLDPWKDADSSGFQLVQSFLAFGRGSFFGVGIAESRQKLFYLPEVHTDFIFSLIGEELGLAGVMVVISIFLWLFIKGVRIAMQTDDPFNYYLTLGLSIMISCQALINFAVALGLVPTKGLPLPFISYGGSALLINMAAAGILINISRSCSKEPVRGKRRR